MAVGSVTLISPRAAPACDGPLLALSAALTGLGLVMMTSASVHLHGGGLDFAVRQALHLGLGVALAWGVWRCPLRFWQRTGPLWLLLGLAALVAVKLPGIGVTVKGSTRWLDLGITRLQVSAPFKLVAMIYLAGYLVRHGEALRRESLALLRPLVLLGVGVGLLLWEPDFGAAAVLLAAATALLFLAGARLLPVLGLFALVGVGAVLLVIFEPYRMRRVIGFLDPWAHARDEGYQLVQALVAFGRGGPFGVGLGNSVQKMFYLPEGHTDFILAVIGEELGWIGVAGILVAFGALLWRIFRTAELAARAGEAFGAWLAYGIGLLLGLTALINMGVNLGVLPTKGLPLPLVSYGGSALLCDLVALGLVQRVYAEARETLAATPGRKPWRR
ncbi:cell division protein FtsW [Methylomarinovum tepidoasis]|uniref:Probable peptidoglycan glycosyltransferase FtsW n=1 Tax=Methylomarinovum tepidoasis TaxID=2840183 RepID=A0AAU9CBG1_9GAMM|nr:putative lipid II flippase FtsW [Methylomarinovum sp. IN45]BCX88021.1 cell division protein FtsW [Methylomarinovum sp. IN45]